MTTIRQNGTLHNSITNVKCEIQDILQSGDYYVTEEIARELSVINNALEHISLDDTFLATSNEWQIAPGNYTQQETIQHLSGVLAAINQLSATLHAFKCNFCNENVTGKQENQLREIHQWAISSFKSCQKNLEPYAYDSADRIKQFGDVLGVTERYTGYRQNLTRGSRQPFRMQTAWMDKDGEVGLMNKLTRSHTTIGSPALDLDHCIQNTTQLAGEPSAEYSEFGGVPPANIGALKKQIRYGSTNPPMRITKGYRTIDSLYPKATAPLTGGACLGSSVMNEVKILNALNAQDFYNKIDQCATIAPETGSKPYQNWTVQEQAGINTVYPGKTEYMVRYQAPDRHGPSPDYKINPTPDFSVYGRPIEAACYFPRYTEYQSRYEWPDASKISKVPWLRN